MQTLKKIILSAYAYTIAFILLSPLAVWCLLFWNVADTCSLLSKCFNFIADKGYSIGERVAGWADGIIEKGSSDDQSN